MTKHADDLKKTLNDIGKNNTPEGVVWVVVKDVDWEQKTMTAESVKDGLDYFDVLLGIGHLYKKPVVGTKCLIGDYENKATSMYLIDAEEVEEIILQVKETKATINEKGYIIEKGNESLKTVLNDWITEVSKIIVVNGTTINIGAMTAIKERLNSILTD